MSMDLVPRANRANSGKDFRFSSSGWGHGNQLRLVSKSFKEAKNDVLRKYYLKRLFGGVSTVELENSNRTNPIDLGKTYGW